MKTATRIASKHQLRRNSLGLPELLLHGVTHIAPATNIVFTFPIIALKAGPDMPVSFLLSTLVCLLIGNTVSEFCRYLPSSGGYYSFATRGLGSHVGFMATWSYLIYDILGPAGCTGFLGYLLSDILHFELNVNIPWWIFAGIAFAMIWAFTHYGVKLSMRTVMIFGGLEILIMLALSLSFLIHPGPGSSYAAPLAPSLAPNRYVGIIAGMVFSILALSGFEAPAPLAQESRNPARLVSAAVTLSLLSIGIFYVVTSYASAIGWGTGNMASFATDPNPFYVLGRRYWGHAWWLIVLAIINSAIGTGLACTNSASRVMYTMGTTGALPARFAFIHPTHKTPTFAIAFLQIAGIIPVLLVGFLLKPTDIFGFLGTLATLAVILLYGTANFALTSYMRKQHPDEFSFMRHFVFPWLGTLSLLPVLFITIYPVPEWPYNLSPYLLAALLIAGFAYMQWIEWRDPGSLIRSAGAIVAERADDFVEIES